MNNLRYDQCSYSEYVDRSVSPLSYIINTERFENVNKCRVELGLVGGTAVSHVSGNMIDLENSLFGIDRPLTHCARYAYKPSAPGAPIQGTCGQFPSCPGTGPCYKTNTYPVIDTTMKHLPSCQFQSFPAIPMPNAAPDYSCQ